MALISKGSGSDMPFMRLRRKKKQPKVDMTGIQSLVQKELEEYTKREDVQEHLKAIQRDERRRKLWNSLSPRKKIKLLRYVVAKKGEQDGKK